MMGAYCTTISTDQVDPIGSTSKPTSSTTVRAVEENEADIVVVPSAADSPLAPSAMSVSPSRAATVVSPSQDDAAEENETEIVVSPLVQESDTETIVSPFAKENETDVVAMSSKQSTLSVVNPSQDDAAKENETAMVLVPSGTPLATSNLSIPPSAAATVFNSAKHFAGHVEKMITMVYHPKKYAALKKLNNCRQKERLKPAPGSRFKTNRLSKADQRAAIAFEAFEAKIKSASHQAKRNKQKQKLIDWRNFVDRGALAVVEGNWRQCWQWLNPQRVDLVLRDPERHQLACHPDDLQRVWFNYYSNLLGDATGHAKDSSFWINKCSHILHSKTTTSYHLNEAFSLDEIRNAIQIIETSKTSGDGMLTSEVYKQSIAVAIADNGKGQTLRPDCKGFPQLITWIVNMVWSECRIPDQWQTSIMTNVYEKGNVIETSSYRGISLMPIGLEILCVALNKRLADFLHNEGILSKEKESPNFRTTNQASLTLHEILRLRKAQDLETHLAVIDFRKTYDLVPHEALFIKLRRLGIKGTILKFIRELYSSSNVCVHVGEGIITEPIPIKRGLRHSCPLSPLLLNVFIDDLQPASQHTGVSVPFTSGLPNLKGLKSANNIAILGCSRKDLQTGISGIEDWLTKYEMKADISRCGYWPIHGGENPNVMPVSMNGKLLPIMDTYTMAFL